jgi:hypothetical protein
MREDEMTAKLYFYRWLYAWDGLFSNLLAIITFGFVMNKHIDAIGSLYWDEWFRVHPDE